MTSALNKVPDGAWFTISLAVILSTVFSTWRYGKERQWRGERRGRLPRLSKLVIKTDDGTLKLTDTFGGGEITNMKGMSLSIPLLEGRTETLDLGLGIFFDKAGGDYVPLIYQEFLSKFEAQPQIQVFLHLKATTLPHVRDMYPLLPWFLLTFPDARR